jgi:phosphate starvation-inducible PhoH-like protein
MAIRERKNDIKYLVQLNEEQKEAKRLIIESEIVIITGRAGCGKTLTAAQTTLDLIFKQEVDKVYVTRPTQQMGDSLGFLPGSLDQKLDPYLDPFKDNLYQCYDRVKVDKTMEEGRFEGFAIQFARGKTIKGGKVLVCDESQNTTKHQMLGLLTRLGKGGRIIIIGDNEQKDIRDEYNGLSYAIELSKKIPEIQWIKLHENHRSDVVGKILDYEYSK